MKKRKKRNAGSAEWEALQRRMREYVRMASGGEREYVPSSAIPHAGGKWLFWTRPVGGGKAREERVAHAEIERVAKPNPKRRKNAMSRSGLRAWCGRASAGDYLAKYEDCPGPDSDSGYADSELSYVRSCLRGRGLGLVADDEGLAVVNENGRQRNATKKRKNAKKRARRANGTPSYRALHWGALGKGGRVGSIPNPKDNREGFIELGEVVRVEYLTAKGGPTRDVFFHDFKATKPKLVVGKQDNRLYFDGGSYKVTTHGIEG